MAQPARGHYKIFLGMAAGVGKTYRMLQEGQAEQAAGRDVVIGILETHGRAETAAQAEGLELLPRREVEYRGSGREEMDLPAIFQRAPELCLIDELAHTNAPGRRARQALPGHRGRARRRRRRVLHRQRPAPREPERPGRRADRRARARDVPRPGAGLGRRGRAGRPDSRGADPAAARGQGLPAGAGRPPRSTASSGREPVRPARGRAAPGGRGGGVEAAGHAGRGARHARGAAARRGARSRWPSRSWPWSRPTRARSASCGAHGARPSGSAPSSTCSTSGRPASRRGARSASDWRRCAGLARCSGRR